nr:hypothetical protein 591p_00056 [Serratia proteamaculans]ULG19639.1 hypothetical protein S-prot-1p1_00055 [Serratia proteamaculans]
MQRSRQAFSSLKKMNKIDVTVSVLTSDGNSKVIAIFFCINVNNH